MGKHKNTAQEEIFMNFMSQHKDLAQGFVKGDRVVADSLWESLKDDLNSHGPPQKETTGWKKVWSDWKSSIRKKLAHNKAEHTSTGGGPFKNVVLSSTEDNVAKICGIFTVVEGIANTFDFGLVDQIECENNLNSMNLNEDVEFEAAQEVAGPSRKKRKTTNNSIEHHMVKQTNAMEKIVDKIDGLITVSDKHNRVTKDIEHTLRKLQKMVEPLKMCLDAHTEETKRHNLEKEKLRREEIQLRIREIEVQELKLDISSQEK